MIARFVRYVLAFELAAYAALAAWLHAARGVSPLALAGLAVAVALGARFLLVCTTCLLGWIFRSPRPPGHRIGIAAGLRYVMREYRALLANNLWYLPWESIALRPDPAPPADSGVPVILVHGYLANRGYFTPMVRWLEGQAIGPVFVPSFPVLLTSIERFAEVLHEEIERIAKASGAARVRLVCHSMGGLAARRYLQVHGPGRVARLVTLGSPHHGTVIASMGVGLNARQMHRGSEFLRALEASEASTPPRVEALSIWSPHDNLVAPQDTAVLPWARSHAVPGVGHVNICGYPAALEVLRAELAA